VAPGQNGPAAVAEDASQADVAERARILVTVLVQPRVLDHLQKKIQQHLAFPQVKHVRSHWLSVVTVNVNTST